MSRFFSLLVCILLTVGCQTFVGTPYPNGHTITVNKDFTLFNTLPIEYVTETSSHGLELCSYEVWRGDTFNITIAGKKEGIWRSFRSGADDYLEYFSVYQDGEIAVSFCTYHGPTIRVETSNWSIHLARGDTVNVYVWRIDDNYSSYTRSVLSFVDTVNPIMVEQVSKREVRQLRREDDYYYGNHIGRFVLYNKGDSALTSQREALFDDKLVLQCVSELNDKHKFLRTYLTSNDYHRNMHVGGYENETYLLEQGSVTREYNAEGLVYSVNLLKSRPRRNFFPK